MTVHLILAKREDWTNKAKIILFFSIPILLPILGVLLPIIQGYFIFKALCPKKEEEREWWERDCKRFKSLTMIFESIPQLIFTSYCYIRAFHDPQRPKEGLSSIQIISMIVSLVSIIQGLLSRHMYFHRQSQKPGISCGLIYNLVFIVFDMMLKLSVTIMSVFIVGIKITLCWIFLFSVLLLIPNLVYNIHDSKQPSKSHRNKVVIRILINNYHLQVLEVYFFNNIILLDWQVVMVHNWSASLSTDKFTVWKRFQQLETEKSHQ